MNELQGAKPDLITYTAAVSVLVLQLTSTSCQAARCSEGLSEDTGKGTGWVETGIHMSITRTRNVTAILVGERDATHQRSSFQCKALIPWRTSCRQWRCLMRCACWWTVTGHGPTCGQTQLKSCLFVLAGLASCCSSTIVGRLPKHMLAIGKGC